MIASFRRTGAARLTRRALSTRGSRRIGPIRRLLSRTRLPREPASSAIRAPAFAGTRAMTWSSASFPDAPTVAIASRCARLLPALQASWDILELEATRQPDTDDLVRHTGMKPLPASLDHRALSEPGAAEQQARTGKEAQPRAGGAEMLVIVHVLDTTAAENPSGVAAGSYRESSADGETALTGAPASTIPVQCPWRSARRPCCPTPSRSRRSCARRGSPATHAARTRCGSSARRCGNRRSRSCPE